MADGVGLGVPTGAAIAKSLQDYGVGVLAGVGYRMVSGLTGSGLIGGAIAAAVTGAVVRGQAGNIIAINLGFQSGQQGLGGLMGGLGNLGGLLGGGGGADGNGNGAPPVATI